LSIRLHAALQASDAPSAVHELEALLAEWPAEREQAAIHYALSCLQSDSERFLPHAARAAQLYRDVYQQTGMIEYRQYYEELTGIILADPPALPPPPEVVTTHTVDLEALLA